MVILVGSWCQGTASGRSTRESVAGKSSSAFSLEAERFTKPYGTHSMFTLSLEQVDGLCRGAALVRGGSIALADFSESFSTTGTVAVVDSRLNRLWEAEVAQSQCGIIPTEAHDRILAMTSAPMDGRADTPNLTCFYEFDERGNRLLKRSLPLISAAVTRLPQMHGYVVSGLCWVRKLQSAWETRAAIIPVNSTEVVWLPGKSAAWLPCGKLAWSDGEQASVGELSDDAPVKPTRAWPHLSPKFHRLFEIDGHLWVATESCVTCLGSIEHGSAASPRRYDWPQQRVSRCVCYPPYVVGSGSFIPVVVLNTRTGTCQTLSLESDQKVKDVFSLDITWENGRIVILTLHRTIHSARAILRIWTEEINSPKRS